MIASSTITRHCVINLHYVRSWPSNFCIEYLTSPGSPFFLLSIFWWISMHRKIRNVHQMKCPHNIKNLASSKTVLKTFFVITWKCTCGMEYHIMSKFWSIKLFLTSQSLPFHVISKRKKKWQFLYAFQIRKRTRRNEVFVGFQKPFLFCLRVLNCISLRLHNPQHVLLVTTFIRWRVYTG